MEKLRKKESSPRMVRREHLKLSGRHADVRYFDEWGNEIEEIEETL